HQYQSMKKIRIILITVLSLFMINAYGQVQVAFGVKGGLNFASLNGTTSLSSAWSNSTGYHVGGYFLFKFTKIGIQPEFLLSRQGHEFTFNGSKGVSNFDYINIPVMLKLYLAGGLNLQAGPQFGFLTSAKGDLINASGTGSSGLVTGQDLKNFLKSSDISVGVGLGWDLPFGLNLAARYNIGASDINKYTGSTVPGALVSSMGTTSAKNQVFQFSVGYRLFKLGH
ncbi:MAG TPA: porin family protein, partial [Cyclobacteriaceae bacterium]|nr:porin family protein [Cyclobacteriaceae bacterium]